MEAAFSSEIVFTTERQSSVDPVSAALLAHEQTLRDAVDLLCLLYPGLIIEHIEPRFRRASSDSPLKDLIEGLNTLSYQTGLGKEIPVAIGHLTGHKVSRDMGAVITLLVMAITTYGFYWVADRILGSKKPQAAPTIIGIIIPSFNLAESFCWSRLKPLMQPFGGSLLISAWRRATLFAR